ncbi:hypothetical protein, partial [Bradyrhizobium sp. 176]
ISSFGRRPSSAHIAESKSLKNSGENTFCQSSASSDRQREILNLRPFAARLADGFLGRADPRP